MGRFRIGTLAAGFSRRDNLSVLFPPFNPTGDWGAVYQLAHPVNGEAELVCDFHGKVLRQALSAYFYGITTHNLGPRGALFDIDF